MATKKCAFFDECEAPICPIGEDTFEGIWYPDEEICRKQIRLAWLKRQKKIKKKAKNKGESYFTLEMLKRNCVIGSGIEGLNPDKEEAPQLEKWLENHPEKRKLSNDEKAVLRERFKRTVLDKKK